MFHKVEWLVDKRVLFVQYRNTVNRESLYQFKETVIHYMQDGEQPIHVIVDNRQVKHIDIDLKSMSDILAPLNKREWGLISIVSSDYKISRLFITMIGALFHLNTQTVSTIDEAKQLITDNDVSVNFHPGL